MRRMRKDKLFLVACLTLIALCILPETARSETTISYSYDSRHRLREADYGDSGKRFYSYDAAGNVDLVITVTDMNNLRSFLFYLSMLEQCSPCVGPSGLFTLRTVLRALIC